MKEIKMIKLRKEEIKVYLFEDDMILYTKMSKHTKKKPTAAKHIQQSSRVLN